jgi:hypothetical protein
MHDARSAGLIREAERYLALIDLFREEGCEPRWQLEPKADHRCRGIMGRERSVPLSFADLERRTP